MARSRLDTRRISRQANIIHQWKMFGAGPGSCEDIFLLECQGQVTRAA